MISKFKYVRSKRLMEMYRTIPCQICGADDGTVCGAHSNQSKHGKGRGIKASDIYCASLCHKCHHSLDFGRASREYKERAWEMAHALTYSLLLIKYGQEYMEFWNCSLN